MKNNIKFIGAALLAGLTISSCSDDFLRDKKNYDQTDTNMYEYFDGVQGRISDVYKFCLPDANSNASWQFTSSGRADGLAKCTEEYSGFGSFVNPQSELQSNSLNGHTTVGDWGFNMTGNIQTMAWGRIRNVNDVIRGVTNSRGITEDQRDMALGQVYFWRAWCYYLLVKWYGGVPIIKEVQDPVAESFVQRSSTSDCIKFICEDLDNAARLLTKATTNGGWTSSEDYGRVTSGTALALKGRVLLLWASPLFNRANDKSRWEDAYDCISKSLPVLASCGHGLAYEGNPGVNASNWAKMFSDGGKANKEGVLVTLYNTILKGSTPDYQKNSNWENTIRPGNALGSGLNPSAMLVDMFPMKDGKIPAESSQYDNSVLEHSSVPYDNRFPFIDRDPRFYRTFAFPGVRWAFSGDPNTSNLNNPYTGDNYVLWNYAWYEKEEGLNDEYGENGSAYGSDNLMSGVKGMYVRKRSDDKDINSSPRYVYSDQSGFERSANTYMEIRYAEVLLNLAEAACQTGRLDVAVEQLQKIRARVGYTSADNYGLQANLSSDEAACMAAILYERQIEFAYEGKRFDDMRRWLLFDGGAHFNEIPGAPDSWTLTGWGGNTCRYLGFKEFNGQRRDNMLFRVNEDVDAGDGPGLGGTTWAKSKTVKNPLEDPNFPDPIFKGGYGDYRPAGIDLTKPLYDVKEEDGVKQQVASQQVADVKEFYQTFLVRVLRKGDGSEKVSAGVHTDYYIKYLPHYYILGLTSAVQDNNKELLQTIGWEDNLKKGLDTFDPLK